MTIGEKIQTLRQLNGLTQLEFGLALGFSKSTADTRVGQYETGFRNPKKATLDKMATVLGVSPSVFGSEKPVERVVQESFWLTPEERLEVCIALEVLDKMEDMVENGNLSKNELTLWKLHWTQGNQGE